MKCSVFRIPLQHSQVVVPADATLHPKIPNQPLLAEQPPQTPSFDSGDGLLATSAGSVSVGPRAAFGAPRRESADAVESSVLQALKETRLWS